MPNGLATAVVVSGSGFFPNDDEMDDFSRSKPVVLLFGVVWRRQQNRARRNYVSAHDTHHYRKNGKLFMVVEAPWLLPSSPPFPGLPECGRTSIWVCSKLFTQTYPQSVAARLPITRGQRLQQRHRKSQLIAKVSIIKYRNRVTLTQF